MNNKKGIIPIIVVLFLSAAVLILGLLYILPLINLISEFAKGVGQLVFWLTLAVIIYFLLIITKIIKPIKFKRLLK